MKTVVLHGSPRKNGSSDTLVEHFLKGLRLGGNGDIKEFFANELSIRPCQGCLTCNKPLEQYCVIEDDMQKIYSAFINANIVVFATPMYWGYMTAQLKAIIDRMEAIASEKYFKGKTFVLIVTYHYHCESTIAFFKRIAKYFGVQLHTIIYHSLDKETDGDVHVSNCKEKLEEAAELGVNLGKLESE
ncbi:MAG: flavodoxin family protein [Candidatus Hodarchaeota archaeon]